jgi:hypothetical protein
MITGEAEGQSLSCVSSLVVNCPAPLRATLRDVKLVKWRRGRAAVCQDFFFNQAYLVKRRQAHDRGLGPVKIQLLHPKKVESKIVSVVLYNKLKKENETITSKLADTKTKYDWSAQRKTAYKREWAKNLRELDAEKRQNDEIRQIIIDEQATSDHLRHYLEELEQHRSALPQHLCSNPLIYKKTRPYRRARLPPHSHYCALYQRAVSSHT